MMGARTNVHDRSVSICRAIPQINISTLQVLIPPTNEFLVASYAPQVSSSTLPGGERPSTSVSYEYPRPMPKHSQRKGGNYRKIFSISRLCLLRISSSCARTPSEKGGETIAKYFLYLVFYTIRHVLCQKHFQRKRENPVQNSK